MHTRSVNDRFYVIKNPQNGFDAIWVHILWDEDTEEKIVWSTTLIPPISDQVRRMVESAIRHSDNEYYMHKNLEALKSEILSIDGIEDQFIPKEFIDSNGQAKILEYMPHLEYSWKIEDFLVPLESGKYNWGYHPDMDTIYTFFRGRYNESQFEILNREEYTSELNSPELLMEYIERFRLSSEEDKHKYYRYVNSQGSYFFHLKEKVLHSVVFFDGQE